jgi:hypothetical protein
MKKLIFLILIMASVSLTGKAQDEGKDMRDQLHFGIKAGGNLSNVYDTEGDEYNTDFKLGFVAGAFVSIPFGKYFGFEPEMLFSQKGYRQSGSILGSDYEITHNENYLDIPLLFAIKPSPSLTILVGPQYSYLMKASTVFKSGDLSIDQESEFDNDNVRKNTLCFLGGLDFNLENIVIGARAGWDIQNNDGEGTSTSPRYKNVWYQATLGFRF